MDEVADGVFRGRGTDVNWVLVREGDEATLVDGGWAGDAAAVEASVRAIGVRPERVRAVLLTHAHIDHLGALPHLHERYGTPALMAPAEVPAARGEHREQARPADLLRMVRRPAAAAWLVRILRAGALRPLRVPHAAPFPAGPDPAGGALDLPGSPVPVLCPGHTSGHSAYLFPSAGVLATGDALVTGHPLSRVTGPQLLPELFSHSPAAARDVLDVLAGQPASVIVPGHGDPWSGSPADAVARARAI